MQFAWQGVWLGGSQNLVAGNFIGTDVSGRLPLGNGTAVDWAAGVGVGLTNYSISAATGNAIRGNLICENGALGIDLTPGGVSPNDPGDADIGVNNLQNFAEITEAEAFLTQTRVAGTLDSLPGTTFAIDFYASATADPSGYGEGERWLGAMTVTTDASGDTSFDEVLPAVAILADANFDPSCVQVDTVVFAGAYAVQHSFEDANADGDVDLVMHFRIEDTNLEEICRQLLADDQNADGVLDSTHQEVQAWLFGQTTLDELFAGVDKMDVFLSGKHLRELLDELFGAGTP